MKCKWCDFEYRIIPELADYDDSLIVQLAKHLEDCHHNEFNKLRQSLDQFVEIER